MEDSILSDLRKAVNAYEMPARAKAIVASSHMLIICGITAAGKNTIVNYLLGHGNYEYVVSHTTRKPRENHGILEQNGKSYWFVSDTQMLQLVRKKSFIEVKAVHGNTFYGTSINAIAQVVKNKKLPVTEIDVQGAIEFSREVPSLRPLFVLPPSFEVWIQRLGTRGYMSREEKQRRFHSAKLELQTAIDNPSFLLIINHEVEQTVEEIKSGIDTSEKAQKSRRELADALLTAINK